MGILRSRHLTIIQRWALSYLLVERRIIRNKELEDSWKNQLFLSDRTLFNQIYNPQTAEPVYESDIITDQTDVISEEQVYDSFDEINEMLGRLGDTLSIVDNRLPANDGEWL
jgi:hypothetical protein